VRLSGAASHLDLFEQPAPSSALSSCSTEMRAIFFDAGNTLLRIDYAAIAAELAGLGVRTDEPAVQRAEWRARVRLDDELFAGRAVSTESRATATRYLELVLEGVGVTDAPTIRAMTEWRARFNPPMGLFHLPDPAAGAALAAARDARLVTGVISNSNGSIEPLLTSLGFRPYLDHVLDSGVVGVEKPDPRIFRMALDRAGVAAHEAVFVGDLYSIDVCGARAAGLSAILLDPGACWGTRDCDAVPDVAAAVSLAVARAPGSS
jgi:putative hydrolase of the HAD superfamily